MRSVLFAVAVTALAAGLVVAPATQQSAQASVLGGLKSGAPVPVAGDLILVGKGGRGGGGFRGGGGGFKGGFRGGGGGFKGGGRAFRGGGGGFKGAYRGGFKGYRGGGRHVYRGGGPRYGYSKGRRHARHWDGGRGHVKGRRYYRGRYYGSYWWYGPSIYVGAYGYGGCAWLRRQAIITGSPYWWDRYYDCVGY